MPIDNPQLSVLVVLAGAQKIEENMTEIYEERVVAYIDILGWKAATNAADP